MQSKSPSKENTFFLGLSSSLQRTVQGQWISQVEDNLVTEHFERETQETPGQTTDVKRIFAPINTSVQTQNKMHVFSIFLKWFYFLEKQGDTKRQTDNKKELSFMGLFPKHPQQSVWVGCKQGITQSRTPKRVAGNQSTTCHLPREK